ncbi:plasmid replication protein RepC [Rhizobium straminoryzae]|uniref:Replication initiation protein RepC n=1 Tax=Rhizobium straminoryzae TaxID=1387186 RepID=A0A549T9Z9_9HYPH|nr:plasmid replication protein RepC [Rhizobium straminoryzae]TRL38699.1 replication initiation protein RepC [Rhizobium straminoryzae]
MPGGHVTTPFGRRPMTLALVQRQLDVDGIRPGKTVDKWKVFRDVAEARELLGLQDRGIAVLDALLTFYPENKLRQDGQLVVFPSNTQLALRAHGMAGATLRRHLGFLVEAGIIIRRDSANGKRYIRKDRAGDIEAAFGFDLSPLLMRAEELAGLAQQVAAARAAFRQAKESLTICRRDIRKLISAAIEEGAPGDWIAIEDAYVALVAKLPRTPRLADVNSLLAEMEALREMILNLLKNSVKAGNISSKGAQNEQHIHSSKPQTSNELEPAFETKPEAKPADIQKRESGNSRVFPLGLVLKACPEVINYGPDGAIGSWRDLMAAAIVVRSMLGISPSAYQEACEILGAENAASLMACILERAGHISSPGGYLRSLTDKARRGEFSIGPMLMALLRARGETLRLVV